MTTPPLWGAPLPEAAIVEPHASLGQANPEEVLRRMLAISPEDAAKVRDDDAEKAARSEIVDR
jgi:hypothetical protein